MQHGVSVGVFLFSDVFVNNFRSGLYGLIHGKANYMTEIKPISIVSSGSFVVWIQVALMTLRRKQLTSSQVKLGTNIWRATLLSIYVVYIVCSGLGFPLANILD